MPALPVGFQQQTSVDELSESGSDTIRNRRLMWFAPQGKLSMNNGACSAAALLELSGYGHSEKGAGAIAGVMPVQIVIPLLLVST